MRTRLVGLVIALMLASSARAQVNDHLKCYKVKADGKTKGLVDLTPPLDADCKVQGPKLYCVPVQKQNVRMQPPAPGAPAGPEEIPHLCYKLKCAKPFPAPTTVTDQFGTFNLTFKGTSMLCTPIASPTTSTTTTASTTSTTVPTCSDGVKNGSETDIDCGGGCPPCANGKMCGADSDCMSSFCSSGVCSVPSTTTTTMPLPIGSPCSGNPQCASGLCVDGFCCNTACSGVCQACSAVKKGSGANGTCGSVAAGTDPDNECTAQPMSSCGTDGLCNGGGACELYPSGTVCIPASCSGDTKNNADTCNGGGVCMDGGSVSCSPYTCAGGACKTSCTTDADCAAGHLCSAGACTP